MKKTHKLVIVGNGAFAEIAHEYFDRDSPYDVVAFAVEGGVGEGAVWRDLPLVSLDDVTKHFDPVDHSVFVAIGDDGLNRRRTQLYRTVKAHGYAPASYVSSAAFVWRNAQMGEHCFIFEDNVVQPFVTLGHNVVLWSGNHIGHHSIVHDNCFIGPHSVISGFVVLGDSCVVGANATFANNLTTGSDCFFGAGAIVSRDVPEDSVVEGLAGTAGGSARRLHRVGE